MRSVLARLVAFCRSSGVADVNGNSHAAVTLAVAAALAQRYRHSWFLLTRSRAPIIQLASVAMLPITRPCPRRINRVAVSEERARRSAFTGTHAVVTCVLVLRYERPVHKSGLTSGECITHTDAEIISRHAPPCHHLDIIGSIGQVGCRLLLIRRCGRKKIERRTGLASYP